MKISMFIHLFETLVVIMTVAGIVITETVKCPRYCTCYLNVTDYMRSVACVAKRLDNIDLSVPRRVQSLDLSNNSISVLEDRGFQNMGLIEIVNLNLRHNSINAISLHSFAGLMYLKRIDLAGNNLYQILPWTFHDNSNVIFISLSGNPLGHITLSGPFLDVPSLEVLVLSHCSFGYFSDEAFSALPSLKRLDISNNLLINFEIFALHKLQYLEELDVSENPWLCNTNLNNLKDYLHSKSCKLIESSCDISNEIADVGNKPQLFEKIISVGVVYSDYEDFNSSEEIDNMNVDETGHKEKEEILCKCQTEEDEPTSLKIINFGLSSIWLILISFQSGVCVTLVLGCFYTYCSRRRKYRSLATQLEVTSSPLTPVVHTRNEMATEPGRQSLHASVETFLCPDTPPPSYRDLYSS